MTVTKHKLILNEVFKPSKLFEVAKDTELTEEEQQLIADGVLLCVFEGESFVLNGKSRNGRVYTKEFWEHVLSQDYIKRRIEIGQMFGQIGHRDTPVSDIDLNNNDYSHKVVKAFIDSNDKGICRYWVFNTESGQSLYRLIKSKTILFVSTRADGDYKEGVTYEGLPIVDESTYELSGWDFVQEPGFLQALPKMLEDKNNDDSKGGYKMNLEEELKKISESFELLKKSLPSQSQPIQESSDVKKLREDFDGLKQKYLIFENLDKSVFESLKGMTSQEISQMVNKSIVVTGEPRLVNHTHESFAYDGVFIPVKNESIPMDKIHNALTNELSENYPIQVMKVSKNESYFGSNGVLMLWHTGKRPEKITESVKGVLQNNAGTLFEGYGVNMAINSEELRSYRSLGTPQKIKETLEKTLELQKAHESYAKLGTSEDIEKALNMLDSICEKLEPVGTVNSIKKTLYKGYKIAEAFKKESDKVKRSKMEEKAKNISSRFDTPIDSVKKMLESIGEVETIKTLKSLKESKVSDKAPKPDKKPVGEGFYSNKSARKSIIESYMIKGGK